MKIILLGYGKMGKTIEQIAIQRNHIIIATIDEHNAHTLTQAVLQQADVAIDFSHPSIAFNHIMQCIDAHIPAISGTTGWLNRLVEVQAYCQSKHGAFLHASNFSVGVHLFARLNRFLGTLMQPYMKNYNIQMEEIHHTQKIDSPSGTALWLANDLLDILRHKTTIVNDISGADNELSIVSKRIDQVPGTHTVRYTSPIDTIEIQHIAHTRNGFALGAVLAAEWILGKTGVFTMDDVLSSTQIV